MEEAAIFLKEKQVSELNKFFNGEDLQVKLRTLNSEAMRIARGLLILENQGDEFYEYRQRLMAVGALINGEANKISAWLKTDDIIFAFLDVLEKAIAISPSLNETSRKAKIKS